MGTIGLSSFFSVLQALVKYIILLHLNGTNGISWGDINNEELSFYQPLNKVSYLTTTLLACSFPFLPIQLPPTQLPPTQLPPIHFPPTPLTPSKSIQTTFGLAQSLAKGGEIFERALEKDL